MKTRSFVNPSQKSKYEATKTIRPYQITGCVTTLFTFLKPAAADTSHSRTLIRFSGEMFIWLAICCTYWVAIGDLSMDSADCKNSGLSISFDIDGFFIISCI